MEPLCVKVGFALVVSFSKDYTGYWKRPPVVVARLDAQRVKPRMELPTPRLMGGGSPIRQRVITRAYPPVSH